MLETNRSLAESRMRRLRDEAAVERLLKDARPATRAGTPDHDRATGRAVDRIGAATLVLAACLFLASIPKLAEAPASDTMPRPLPAPMAAPAPSLER